MPQRKIDIGNAEDVIQRGRNVTIVPRESSSQQTGIANVTAFKVRYWAMDVANGGPPPNPNSINVNLETFPSWKVAKYDCATGACPAMPVDQQYVEVVYNLDADWTDAYLAIEIRHATDEGAAADEKMFKVYAASILGDVSDLSPTPVTYSLATGNIMNPIGLYVWHIATTDSDEKRIMLMGMRDNVEWDWLHDEVYLESVSASRGLPQIIYVAGKFTVESFLNPLTTMASTDSFPYQVVAV